LRARAAVATGGEAAVGTAPQREWRGGSRDDAAWRFHEAWLGYVQPREGLLFSVPVLAEAECHDRQKSTVQAQLALLCRTAPRTEGDRLGGLHADREGCRRTADVEALLTQILDYAPEDFDRGGALPADLQLYVPEGPQELRATFGLQRRGVALEASPEGLIPDASTPASRAGARYLLLVGKLRDGLPFDKVETETGAWAAPPSTKFDRLLRACRVDIGLLANGDEVRLIYAPHGGASGSVTFRLADMVGAGGDARHIVDAFKNLLGAQRFFAVAADRQLPALLRASRERQADVTKALSGQVLDALGILVAGMERAAERGDGVWLDELLARARADGDNTLYEGLLTVLLRLVFCLYAEDKGLLPIDSAIYENDYSVHALFNQLQEDHATHPDTMDRRFGAWDRLLSLFRAIHGGATHGDLDIPARHGEVFDPRRFPFLENAGGRVPAIDDETVYKVLEELIILEGQRLSYRALDVEQLGSVYEGLMGFRVERLGGPAVCLRGNRVWVVAREVLARAAPERASYLEDDVGVERGVLKKIAAEVKAAHSEAEMVVALEAQQSGRAGRAGKGRLVVQPGLERRRTSSHYTPRELTERVVGRALEPLLGAMGGAPSSERLLNLKICDPAMGSGAFLVAACRFLAEQVVAAWTREGKQGELGSVREDALLRAKRLVAQRCLYGVDKNPLAVNLAKMSLWLETMARGEPFTFVDHALRHGDSLVGLSLDQIRAFHWEVENRKQLELPFGSEIDEALTEVLQRRQRILDLAHQPDIASGEKVALLRDAEDALERPRLIADLLLGAWWAADKDKEREAERLRRKEQVVAWLREGGEPPTELCELVAGERKSVTPFHWMMEFPEIFYAEREDPLDQDQRNQVAWIDAIVGNPPFAGKNGVIAIDPLYLPWLQHLHTGAHGNADLVAHFLRRGMDLLGDHGTIGLVATKTIAQGDTRQTGLKPVVEQGAVIYDAVRNMPWPGEAAVSVALLHLAKGRLKDAPGLVRRVDARAVANVNSRLLGAEERPDPRALQANEGLCYQGSIVLGMGFVLTPEERKELIRKNPANGKLIFPYLGGEEMNTSPTHDFDRYVINFGEMSLEEAEGCPDLLRIVREKVKPERDKNNRETRRKHWWRFGETTPALNAALSIRRRCLVTARVTKHLSLSFQPANRVLSEQLFVFVLEGYEHFAVLQSRIHEHWARLLSSSMKTDLRYAASDCFDTFPFPDAKHLTDSGSLAQTGKRLYDVRSKLMVDRNQGLTVTYNQLKDPANRDAAIVALRGLHEDMDRAVLEAYGWSDIHVPPFETPTSPEQKAAFERFSDAVIDRLFALNAERAAAEERSPPAISAPKAPRRGPKRTPPATGRAGARASPQRVPSKRKKAS
jgi:hypothetical protein